MFAKWRETALGAGELLLLYRSRFMHRGVTGAVPRPVRATTQKLATASNRYPFQRSPWPALDMRCLLLDPGLQSRAMANSEHLAVLKRGVRDWNAWRKTLGRS